MNQRFELFLSGTDVPHRYKVSTPGQNGDAVIEDFFELRSDSVELTMTLSALAKAGTSGEKPEKDLHLEFGQRIYNLVFGGAVGQCWQERRKSAGRKPLALVLRINPATARFLQRIPWEYMHDGKDFLSTNWRTPVYRLPANLEPDTFEPLKEALRLLVVIAAPLGLNENEVLNFAREEDLILAATSQARKTGKLRVEFAPNGSLEILEQYLREYNPHLLHFVGHGVFVDSADSGLLLMETRDGHRREVWNKDFTEAIVKNGRELRGVFLSACQSAVASRAEGFGDLASHLMKEGIPAVTAMQYSVLNTSAMVFGSAFYKGIADGKLIEDAITEARQALRTNSVDFATPVLFLSNPNCLRVDIQVGQSAHTPLDFTGLTKAQNFVGRAGEIRELQTRLDPQTGTWRAAVIHAIGGMGKTVLAARLAERMASRLDGVISIRMAPTMTAQNVLDHIGDFLFSNNAHFNLSEIHLYQENRSKPLELSARVSALAQILRKLRLLVIFDNCEDILPQGREVSRATGMEQPASLDPELLPLISMLVGNVDGPSRFLFTSRVDFSPVEENRLADAIGHLSLKEMGFREAVYLMETLPPLDGLPVAILNQTNRASPQPFAMRDVYERLGGHPYRLNLFAKHSARSSITQVLDDLSGVQQELLEFTLLEKAVAQLPERAALLLHRGVVFDEPVPVEGLAFMLGDDQDAMPEVTAELWALLDWGMAAREPGTENYSIHSLVRDWAQEQWSETQGKEYLRRAARYWQGVTGESHSLWDHLRARKYLFQAGDYEEADNIVQITLKYLFRWGHMNLVLVLLRQSADTLEGMPKAFALGNMGKVFQSMGDYRTAMLISQEALRVLQEAGDQRNTSAALHNIGILHQQQGEYEQAREYYQQALKIKEEIGDRGGMSKSLHQIGNLHSLQGEYTEAREYYQRALQFAEESGDWEVITGSLHQIGNLHSLQGEYPEAREYYQRALQFAEESGDRAAIAGSLHNIGMLHQRQGEYARALKYYQQALRIKEEIGDRAGVATDLNVVGNLHFLQGQYAEAREYYQQSLKIREELGERVGMASSLHGIGMLHQQQGEYEQARKYYQQALKLAEKIGDRAGIAASLHQIGNLYSLQGEYIEAREYYQQTLRILNRLGDRAGMSVSLHGIGILHQQQGEYVQAEEYYQQALRIQQELGDWQGMSKSLHQIGILHQQQGKYVQAEEYYQQSLKIIEEIGDRAGRASSLGQLGLLYEKTQQLEKAIQALATAFVLFTEMRMPDAGQVKGDLIRLQSQIGKDAFSNIIQALDLSAEAKSTMLRVLDDRQDYYESEEFDFRRILIQNTIAVLTAVPDNKGRWWDTLRKLQIQARDQNESTRMEYLKGLMRLVEGTSPKTLAGCIPDEFKSDWQAILNGISEKE